MGKKSKTPITVNDTEYFKEDMSGEQQLLLDHVQDLDRKLRTTQFNVDQLTVGRQKFIELLAASLEAVEDVEEPPLN
tara:strand:- start:250 stop:480 length:231 start_codon:yes stop_codon:yes gene_type:complete